MDIHPHEGMVVPWSASAFSTKTQPKQKEQPKEMRLGCEYCDLPMEALGIIFFEKSIFIFQSLVHAHMNHAHKKLNYTSK